MCVPSSVSVSVSFFLLLSFSLPHSLTLSPSSLLCVTHFLLFLVDSFNFSVFFSFFPGAAQSLQSSSNQKQTAVCLCRSLQLVKPRPQLQNVKKLCTFAETNFTDLYCTLHVIVCPVCLTLLTFNFLNATVLSADCCLSCFLNLTCSLKLLFFLPILSSLSMCFAYVLLISLPVQSFCGLFYISQ